MKTVLDKQFLIAVEAFRRNNPKWIHLSEDRKKHATMKSEILYLPNFYRRFALCVELQNS